MDESASPLHQDSQPDVSAAYRGVGRNAATSHYVYEFVKWARSHPSIVVTHLILHPRPGLKVSLVSWISCMRSVRSVKTHGLYFVISEWALQTVETLEQEIIKRDKHHSQHLRKCDLSSLVEQIQFLSAPRS